MDDPKIPPYGGYADSWWGASFVILIFASPFLLIIGVAVHSAIQYPLARIPMGLVAMCVLTLIVRPIWKRIAQRIREGGDRG